LYHDFTCNISLHDSIARRKLDDDQQGQKLQKKRNLATQRALAGGQNVESAIVIPDQDQNQKEDDNAVTEIETVETSEGELPSKRQKTDDDKK